MEKKKKQAAKISQSFTDKKSKENVVGVDKKINLFSFFSGAGFLDLGFELSGGFNVVFVNEFHKAFLEVYKHSRKRMGLKEPLFGYNEGDITKFLTKEEFRNILNVVSKIKREEAPVGFIGGPPCPDFSVAGKQRGRHGENGKLSETYIELICRLKPDFFLFENVKGLYRTAKHRGFFEEMKVKLRKAGYVLTERLVNALQYGAPQDRERILLVGFQKKSPRLGFDPQKTIASFPWKKYERADADMLKTFAWPDSDPFKENSETQLPPGIPEELTVNFWFRKNNVEDHPNTVHFFKPRAGLKRFLSVAEGDDKKKSYKRLHRWRYSPTAAYGNNEVHLHPFKARRITIAEALAIQSLPQKLRFLRQFH